MRISFLLLITLLIASNCNTKTNTTNLKNEVEVKLEKQTKQLRHVVLFKFKKTTTETDIEKLETKFASLPNKIKEIKGFEWGRNNSTETLNKGFTHCFLVTFNSEKERSIYLPHPAHMDFVDVLTPYLEDVLVLDYWTK